MSARRQRAVRVPRVAAPKIKLEIDPRTDAMSPAALACRSKMHIWVEIPLTLAAVERMLGDGVITITYRCSNSCGGLWVEKFNPMTWERVDTRRIYEDNTYLAPKGKGRLPKAEAMKAMMSRRFPGVWG